MAAHHSAQAEATKANDGRAYRTVVTHGALIIACAFTPIHKSALSAKYGAFRHAAFQRALTQF
jgi:hypothetical protein